MNSTFFDNHELPDDTFSYTIFRLSTGVTSSTLDGDFLWFQLFIEVLLRMSDRQLAKEDFLSFARGQFAHDPIELRKIEEFSTHYVPDDAIKWYTRSCFIYDRINYALRIRNLKTLYMMRLLILDIYQQLDKIKSAQQGSRGIFNLYRGQAIASVELKQLSDSQGKYVTMNSFLSTSANRPTSLWFAHASDNLEPVLFTIRVDPQVAPVKPFACISAISYVKDEEETLFMLGSIFRLCSVQFDATEQVWLINMELCSDDESQIKPALQNLKEHGADQIRLYELARIIFSLGNRTSTTQLVQRFIREEASNQATVACCYSLLGIAETNYGCLHRAIAYHQQALRLKRKHLPSNHPYIPYSHYSLGLALQKHGDLVQAREQFSRALKLWQRQYPSGPHENIALCLQNIGMIDALQGNVNRASDYFARAHEMMCTCLVLKHPQTVNALRNIRSSYGHGENVPTAKEIFEKVLDIQQWCLPATHADVAKTLHILAVACFNLDRFNVALTHYKEALDIIRQTLPSTRFLRHLPC